MLFIGAKRQTYTTSRSKQSGTFSAMLKQEQRTVLRRKLSILIFKLMTFKEKINFCWYEGKISVGEEGKDQYSWTWNGCTASGVGKGGRKSLKIAKMLYVCLVKFDLKNELHLFELVKFEEQFPFKKCREAGYCLVGLCV